jgi:hypothetical protein
VWILPRIDAISVDQEIMTNANSVIAALLARGRVGRAVLSRIQQRSALARDRIEREHGLVNIAVPAIRNIRDS